MMRFLRWYCNPELLEEIEGDVQELYERRYQDRGYDFASRKLFWDVIRFFRWTNIKRTNSKYTMDRTLLFRNYLKLGFRTISKHWVTSTINIVGLGLALGLGITIFIFVDMQLHMDSFHQKKERIYQITNDVKEENALNTWGDTPMQLGPQLKSDYPIVEDYARIEYSGANFKYKDNIFAESFIYTDPSFFRIFDFPMLYGSKDALNNKSGIVISHDMAVKYFDNEDPVGKELTIKFNSGQVKRFVVSAVLDKYPDNASFSFNFYLSIENFFDSQPDKQNSWNYLTDATFLLFREDANPFDIESSYDSYVEVQNASNGEWTVAGFDLFHLPTLSQKSFEIVSSVSNGSHPAGRVALAVISIFILILACFNFMNISVAAATKRLREIGLRKVMGGIRRQIIGQFMVENLLQCLFAMILGTMISYFVILPIFNKMIPIHIPFEFSSFPLMFGFFAAILIVTGFISGAYPAFYISKFEPVHIFRSGDRFGKRNMFSKILLGFQFFFAFVTIVGSFVFTDNAYYFTNKDWGYEPKDIFSIPVENSEQAELLKARLADHSEVTETSVTRGQIGIQNFYVNYDYLGEQYQSIIFEVDGNYQKVMNLPLIEGRFIEDTEQDLQNSVVVNETFVEKMGWDNPIGQVFQYDSVRKTVVGVVQDFHYYSFYRPVEGVFFSGLRENSGNQLVVKSNPGSMLTVDEFARESWFTLAPNDPYDRKFQEDVFDDFFYENRANITLMLLISGVTIVLATLGLYGLFSFNIQRRLREFSVRKVLGAAPIAIVKIASKQYVWIILVAFVLGAPLGFILIDQLVTSIYPDPKGAGPLPFVVAILIVLLTISITIAGQILKATRVNPAENLRAE